MKLLFISVMTLWASSSVADLAYLHSFIGNYSVVTRNCDQTDTLCRSVASFEIVQDQNGQYFANEKMSRGGINGHALYEYDSPGESASVSGSFDFALWRQVAKPSHSTLMFPVRR